jgi:hypothetical protein
MSQVIEQYLNECKDPALTSEHKTRVLNAIVPNPTGEMFTLSSSTSESSLPLENTDTILESKDPASMPIVDVDKEAIQAILSDLQKDGVDDSTRYWIFALIQSEVYGELRLSNDEQVITALTFLKTCGYNSITIEDCIQIINTPEDRSGISLVHKSRRVNCITVRDMGSIRESYQSDEKNAPLIHC